jgi:sulfur carrier protein
MKIVVNGEEKEVREGITVAELLKELGILEKTMATAIDMQVVKKEEWDKRVVREGEKVEFLHFVGGG